MSYTDSWSPVSNISCKHSRFKFIAIWLVKQHTLWLWMIKESWNCFSILHKYSIISSNVKPDLFQACPAHAACVSLAPLWRTQRKCGWVPDRGPRLSAPLPGSSHSGLCAAFSPGGRWVTLYDALFFCVLKSCGVFLCQRFQWTTIQTILQKSVKGYEIRHNYNFETVYSHPPCILVRLLRRPSGCWGWKCWALTDVRLLCGKSVFPRWWREKRDRVTFKFSRILWNKQNIKLLKKNSDCKES